jgi:hypothetical protein
LPLNADKNYLTLPELILNLLNVIATADIMFFRFERQTLGQPAHASRAEYAVRRRHSEERRAERA